MKHVAIQRRRNANTLRLISYPGRAHTEALISLFFTSRNYTNTYISRLLWGFSLPVIIRSGAQFTEELWKLCFHCNCRNCFLFVYFILFCFWDGTYFPNEWGSLYVQNLVLGKSKFCSKNNKNSSWAWKSLKVISSTPLLLSG